MPKLRVLAGADLLAIFADFGFRRVSQRGSHVKLRRVLPDGFSQTLTIVTHDVVDKGTLRAIYRQALRYVTDGELRPRFYGE